MDYTLFKFKNTCLLPSAIRNCLNAVLILNRIHPLTFRLLKLVSLGAFFVTGFESRRTPTSKDLRSEYVSTLIHRKATCDHHQDIQIASDWISLCSLGNA